MYIVPMFQKRNWDNIIMSQCIDHGTTFLETLNKIPPDRYGYGFKRSLKAGFSPGRAIL